MCSVRVAVILLVVAFSSLTCLAEIWPTPRDVMSKPHVQPFTLSATTLVAPASEEDRALLDTSGLISMLNDKHKLSPMVSGPEKVQDALTMGNALIIGRLDGPALVKELAALPLKPDKDYPGKEGYILDISDKRVLLAGRDTTGVFFGLMTLRQLLAESPTLKAMQVVDWPEYDMRAVYLAMSGSASHAQFDVARKVIDLAASLKYDQVCVELDNGGYARLEMAVEGGKSIAAGLKELFKYCRDRGLEPRPEGRMCFFPMGEYPHPDKFAGDPTWLECIRTTEMFALKGVAPTEFTIQRYDRRGQPTGEPIPVRNVMHDLATGKTWDKEPVVVKSEDGAVIYKEGKDYELKYGKIAAHWFEKVNYGTGQPKGYGYSVLRWANYAPDREPTTIRRTEASAIPDGAKVAVEFSYIGPDPYSRWKYRECLSDPRLYAKDRSNPVFRLCTDVFDLVDPKTSVFGIEYDEYRTIGWDYKCLSSGLTRPEMQAKYIKAQVDFVLEKKPGTKVVMWSDMIDPHHNATDYKLTGTAEILAKDGYNKKIIAQPWHSGVAEESIKYLTSLGFSLMPSCQGEPPDSSALKWRHYMDRHSPKGSIKALQYTHWEGVEGWGKIVSGEDKQAMEAVRMVSGTGWSLAPHVQLDMPKAAARKIILTARVTGDLYYFTTEGGTGEVRIGEEAGSGGKGRVVKGSQPIQKVVVNWRKKGETTFTAVDMTLSQPDVYTADVPTSGAVEVYIEAKDASHTTRFPVNGVLEISVPRRGGPTVTRR